MSKNTNSRRITKRTYDTTIAKSLTTTVVEAISDHKRIDALDPDFLLYEEVNIESLDGLVNSDSPQNLQIQFRVKDVTVHIEQETDAEFSITVTDSEHKE